MPIVICKNCGATYSYKEQTMQMRDKDYQRCEVCHTILMEWNGGINYYDFQLIAKENEVSYSEDQTNNNE